MYEKTNGTKKCVINKESYVIIFAMSLSKLISISLLRKNVQFWKTEKLEAYLIFFWYNFPFLNSNTNNIKIVVNGEKKHWMCLFCGKK